MNFKRTYYSYSRLWCFLKDPQEYKRKYIDKIWDPPTDKMLLGTIFSDAYAGIRTKRINGKYIGYDWKTALKYPQRYYEHISPTLTYTPDFERAMNTALNHPKLLRALPNQCEQTVRVESTICPLQMKNDGLIEKQTLVIENKYGVPWSKERAFGDDQISFYSYVYWLMFGEIPTVRLQSVNSRNGNVEVFEVIKNKKQYLPLEEKIKQAYQGILQMEEEYQEKAMELL